MMVCCSDFPMSFCIWKLLVAKLEIQYMIETGPNKWEKKPAFEFFFFQQSSEFLLVSVFCIHSRINRFHLYQLTKIYIVWAKNLEQ